MTDPGGPSWGAPQAPDGAAWGDPRVPGYDPRSPEWRDPNTRPWWDNRNAPPPGFPASPMYPPPPQGPRRNRLYAILAAAVVIVLVVGVALVATRGPAHPSDLSTGLPLPIQSTVPIPPQLTPVPASGAPSDPATPLQSLAPTDDTDPVSVTRAYYGDLAANHPTAAFNLLCSARQQAMPLSAYASAYADDVSTGTGVKTFTPTGQPQERGDEAAVPGTLVLADKESVPITVLLLMEGESWRVCSSDLGGVLPNPGTGSSGSTGGVTT